MRVCFLNLLISVSSGRLIVIDQLLKWLLLDNTSVNDKCFFHASQDSSPVNHSEEAFCSSYVEIVICFQ